MKPWHVKTRVSRGAMGNARWTLRNDAHGDEAFVYWNGTGARLQLELPGFERRVWAPGLTFIDTPGADAPCMTFADARKAVAAFVDALNTEAQVH